MQFKDEYKKMNKKNRLSEDYIKDLAAKMTDVYEQSEKETKRSETYNKINECKKYNKQEIQTTIVRHDSKKSIRRKISVMTAAAVAVVFISSIAVLCSIQKYLIADPVNDPDAVTPGFADENQYTQKVTEAAVSTLAGAEAPQTGTESDEKDITQICAPFSSQDELESFAVSKKAEGSPLDIGYKAAGYEDIFGDYYNIKIDDLGYWYEFKDPDALQNSSLKASYDESGQVISVNNVVLSKTDIEQFNRLLSYADKNIGIDNYYIYDMYTYNYYYKMSSETSYTNNGTQDAKCDYCLKLVVKDYYDRYKNTDHSREAFVVTLEIANDYQDLNSDQTMDSVLKSGYECFMLNQNVADSFYNDFNTQFADCAVGIENITEEYSSTGIYRPYTTWVRPTKEPDEQYSRYIDRYEIPCIMPELGDMVTDAVPVIDISLYFKSETDPDDITRMLSEMQPLFDKYNIKLATVDILNNDSDFQRYKESGGYIPDKAINSSYRRYCATYSDEFPDWSTD
ncbi:MAG: hypothetical protein Q4F95_14015 [Oscillospiraceae bacterium]|nr:hypothetical protein [Oscillospiraceae bacterium]